MAADVRTITIGAQVLRRLRLYRAEGKTYAEILEDFMDAIPPRTFLQWAERDVRLAPAPYLRIRKRLLAKRR